MTMGETDLYLGVMTGTSLDAADCALAAFGDKSNSISFYSYPIPSEIRSELMTLATAALVDAERLVRMHFVLAQLYAGAVKGCLEQAEIEPANVRAIGLHGQTVRHLPKKIFFHADFAPVGATFQLGSGAALAALTGIDVVYDFRSADVALGGEGAPLVPMFDKRFLYSSQHDRLTLNIGGIANITYLPRWEQGIMAFDTGPGNMIIDALMRRYFGESFDKDGMIASQGAPDELLLARMLAHHYFAAPPPKSTGRELFGEEFLTSFIEEVEAGRLAPGDAIRTATELTARTIASGVRSVHPKIETIEIVASGGGTGNRFLLKRIKELLAPAPLKLSDAYGIPSREKEALAFAYFAKAFLDRDRIHLPETTGASRKIVLGSLARGT